jgi:hypothetical protein
VARRDDASDDSSGYNKECVDETGATTTLVRCAGQYVCSDIAENRLFLRHGSGWP